MYRYDLIKQAVLTLQHDVGIDTAHNDQGLEISLLGFDGDSASYSAVGPA